jgi:hypothetical protein
MDIALKPTADEASRLAEDSLWAEKQHFAMATVCRRLHLCLGIPSAIMAGVAGISALQSRPTLAAILAICSAVITSLLTFLEPAELGSRHHQAGVSYSALRGKLRRFRLIDLASSIQFDEARKILDALASEKSGLMKTSPHIGGLSYHFAKRSIQRDEHKNEIDVAEAGGPAS